MTKDKIRYLVSADHNSLARYLQSQLIIGEEPFIKKKKVFIFAFYTPPRSDIASAIQGHTFDFVSLNERRFTKKKENQNWREYILRGDEIVGHLELVEISNERSAMFFVFSPDKFHQALSIILSLVSAIWSINEVKMEPNAGSNSKDSGEDSTVDPVHSGNLGTVFDADRESVTIQPGEPKAGRKGWQKFDYDDYLIEHWNRGETAKEVVKGINENRLGNIKVGRFYNRKSEISKAHPEIKIRRAR